MGFTRLDCHFFRGSRVRADHSSYVALNPEMRPGSMVMAVSCAARESIGSQVACRLSLEHFVDGVLAHCAEAPGENGEPSVQILEAGFRNANTSVYSFGHKLAAGGRMAASLLGLVIAEDMVAAGRAGGGSVYLFRNGELFPFFEEPQAAAASEEFVGTNSLVSVELASVPIQPEDILYLFGTELSPEKEQELHCLSAEMDYSVVNPCWEISKFLFDAPEEVPVAMLARVGPDVIYLDRPLAAGI